MYVLWRSCDTNSERHLNVLSIRNNIQHECRWQKCKYGAMAEWQMTRGNRKTRKKKALPPSHFAQRGLTWDRTRASAVRSRQLTACARGRFVNNYLLISIIYFRVPPWQCLIQKLRGAKLLLLLPVTLNNLHLHTHIIYIYIYIHTHIYRVSQEGRTKLRESVPPYVKLYRYNPKHLCPKLNGYGDKGTRKVWSFCGSTYCTWFAWRNTHTLRIVCPCLQLTFFYKTVLYWHRYITYSTILKYAL